MSEIQAIRFNILAISQTLARLEVLIRHCSGQLDLLLKTQADPAEVAALSKALKRSGKALKAAIAANSPTYDTKESTMPNPLLAKLTAQVQKNTEVEGSAVTLITGFADRINAAVAAVIANGATEEQLAPIQAEVDAMNASADALAAAVAANTPAAAPKKKPKK